MPFWQDLSAWWICDLAGGIQVKERYPGKLRRETQLREGFVITHVNGEEVKTLGRFRQIILESKNDRELFLQGRRETRRIFPAAFIFAGTKS